MIRVLQSKTFQISVLLSSVILIRPFTAYANNYKYPISEIHDNDDILKIAQLNENEIDIGWLALVFAKELFPELDIKRYDLYLDMMTQDIRTKMIQIGKDDPDTRIRVLNTYFFKVIGFQYDNEDILGKKLTNRTINGLMDTQKGSCWSLPLLYLAVSQRLDYPIYPVSAPQHIFLRYEDPSLDMKNIEATAGGYSSDEEYIYVLQIPNAGIESGAYMRSLTYREFLGEMLAENGRFWALHGDIEKGIFYLEQATKLQPTGAEILASLSLAYYEMAQSYRLNYEYYIIKANETMDRAESLGLAPMMDENYIAHQTNLQNKYRNEVK